MMKGLNIRVPNRMTINKLFYDFSKLILDLEKCNLKYPLIVKPSKGGSSIGISLVCSYTVIRKCI